MNDLEKEIEKLFHKLEKYIDDFEFQGYIGPLIGDPDNLRVEEVKNLKKVFEYYKEYGIYLPLPNDPRYKHIENYKDYEYTYCIAYEMAIRTDDFYHLKGYDWAARENEWIQEILNIGLDPSTYIFPEDMIILDSEYKFRLLYQSKKYLSIDDYDNGLYLLIEYCLENEKIYQINSDLEVEKIRIDLTKGEKYTLINQIFNNYQNYYIVLIDSRENKSKLTPLHQDLPIKMLDSKFLEMIKERRIKYKPIDTKPEYTRPTLKFKDSKIINLQVNLNLPKKELVAYTEKIKDDYDKNESIIQTPMELLGKKLEKAIEPNSLKKMPTKMKRKIAFANAFCVYDLYKVLTSIFETKESEFKEKQNSGETDREERNSYDKLELQSEISSIVGISEDKVKYYQTLMTEYIDNKKYKELIAGYKQDAGE